MAIFLFHLDDYIAIFVGIWTCHASKAEALNILLLQLWLGSQEWGQNSQQILISWSLIQFTRKVESKWVGYRFSQEVITWNCWRVGSLKIKHNIWIYKQWVWMKSTSPGLLFIQKCHTILCCFCKYSCFLAYEPREAMISVLVACGHPCPAQLLMNPWQGVNKWLLPA